MKARLVELLACQTCGGRLELRDAVADRECEGEIKAGELVCLSCAARFSESDGMPGMVAGGLAPGVERMSAAFGWQWKEFVELYDQYEAQFLDWIHPIQPDFFRDKVVLDAGCGNGRHAYYAGQYGAREVVAMDLSDAVETAYANLGKMPNVHVVQGDLYHPPFARPEHGEPFDFIYSIGVLHHRPDPEAGVPSLVRFGRPGGATFPWGYRRETNGL